MTVPRSCSRSSRRVAASRRWRSPTWCASTRSSATGPRPPRRTSDCAPSGLPEQPGAIAHYYCELAEVALAERDLPAAHAHLRSAHREQREFGRSAILRGDLARLEGDTALAVRLYGGVVQRDFHLLPVVLPRLAEVARQSGDDGVLTAVIDDLIRRGAASRAEIAYAAILSGHYELGADRRLRARVAADRQRSQGPDRRLPGARRRAHRRAAPRAVAARCATSCCATRATGAASAGSTARPFSGAAPAAMPGTRCARSPRSSSCRAPRARALASSSVRIVAPTPNLLGRRSISMHSRDSRGDAAACAASVASAIAAALAAALPTRRRQS